MTFHNINTPVDNLWIQSDFISSQISATNELYIVKKDHIHSFEVSMNSYKSNVSIGFFFWALWVSLPNLIAIFTFTLYIACENP